MLSSYHVHSNLSDGIAAIPEIVEAAVLQGLDEIGISDHYVLTPDGSEVEWSAPLDALPRYFECIESARREYDGRIIVRAGIEADYDPATIDRLRRTLAPYAFDYIIGAVHFFDGFPIDRCKADWDAISESERNAVIRGYWARVAEMADEGFFDIVAHPDIYKKFGYLPTIDLSTEIVAAIDSISRAGMSIELNTSGWFKEDILEAYPSQPLLRMCRERGIAVMLSADAHSVDDLTRAFTQGCALLRETGYTSAVAWQSRTPRSVPLPF